MTKDEIIAMLREADEKIFSDAPTSLNKIRRAICALTAQPPEAGVSEAQTVEGIDIQEYKDALSDLVHLKAEEWALTGGGPRIEERWRKAWETAEELVRVEP